MHEFAGFVGRVAKSLSSGRQVRLDLRTLKRLYPCGLLLFMGHIDSWLNDHPGKLSAHSPTDSIVEQMLHSVGVLAKLGLTSKVEISHTDVTRWQYFTGTDADAQEMAPMMGEIRQLIGVDSQSMLYDSIVEAMTNVRQHAYEDESHTKWWMFSTISAKSITIAIHDRGDSIPGTLMRKPGVREYITRIRAGRKKTDGWLINLATQGRSSTKLPYRGKGLPEMLESTKEMTGSSLGIFSREGVFRCTPKNQLSHVSCARLEWPIIGTLVMWRIRLSEAAV